MSQSACTLAGMKVIELWRWRLRDLRGKLIDTRYAMREADALARDPQAVRVPGTRELRSVPDTLAEMACTPGAGFRSGLPARGWWRQPEPFIAERLRR
jgi:hypothetical protein